MEGEIPSRRANSLFDRTVARPRPRWATLGLMLLAFAPTVTAAYLMGYTDLDEARSRSLLAAPTVIAYILVLGQVMGPLDGAVVRSLRPILLVHPEELDRIVQRASSVPRWQEIAAITCGLIFGLLIIGPTLAPGDPWPMALVMATGYVMLGLLGWAGFVSVAGTRLVSTLLRLPMRVDPLDRKPFEAIGRQSLGQALAFVGGITIGLILGGYGSAVLLEPRFWLLFLPLTLLPVVIFYLNMRPTHRVLSLARDRALGEVQRQLRRAFPALLERMQKSEPTGTLPSEVNALVAYERQLQEAATWPYNPTILRTMVVSILIPSATVLARRLFEVYIQ